MALQALGRASDTVLSNQRRGNAPLPDRVPAYLLGQAQRSFRDQDAADHPLVLMQDIAREALADAGIPAQQVDAIACVDPFSWTYAGLAGKVAEGIGCPGDIREFWLPAGGTTPQDLLHEIAAAMAAAELNVAVLVGAEAMRTRRKAARAGSELPWPPRDTDVKPTRGQQPFASERESKHGLRLPIQSFPILENAIRHAHGRSAEAQIRLAAELLHKNALVAASNPHAWFQDAPSVDAIARVTSENRMIAYPYTKRMNAIMDVDQAAALVIVSDRYLEKSGQRHRAAAVLGGAGAEEVWFTMERASLSECAAMKVALQASLAYAGLKASEIDAFDFYSCFPAPIQLALDALQISSDDPRQFSITGGLAYAGGPGNNYVTHALATALAKLRLHPEQRLMVTGVGMANAKHAATLLSHATQIPDGATGETRYRLETGEQPVPVATEAQGKCTVVSYTIEYDRAGQPMNVIYILDTATGERAIANSRNPATDAATILSSDPIGQPGTLSWDDVAQRQYFHR